ncbi:hypothetical protein E1B28_001891 [Marasmius oreades]|uniref:Uncharacterized protein n=1 Tax=Marasmius oreades TaxID=181124 RepID=A0A9P7V4H8_9AGAR|nr:uncharacterized protein E1B28_001891 [Marasmius oreades]KAG7100111.1 hypothetical protein E1B28_001891 [Marasmius oreades]
MDFAFHDNASGTPAIDDRKTIPGNCHSLSASEADDIRRSNKAEVLTSNSTLGV